MQPEAQARFDAGAEAWMVYQQGPRGVIRHEVTWHQLRRHLPETAPGAEGPRILDAGCGSGELALRLAEAGCRVWLLDYAPAMLEQARQAARELPADVRARVTLCDGPVSKVPELFELDFFHTVVCHTLIEYLPEPRSALTSLVGALRAGGLLSLVFVNRHAEVLRRVWHRGDPAGALTLLEGGAFCAELFGVSGAAYAADEVGGWLEELGLTVVETLGVRIFADQVPDDRLREPEFLDALLCLEIKAASRSPYRELARYVHLVARKEEQRAAEGSVLIP